MAWLYYVKNLTQSEIAAKMKLSRPTVINYLRLAKAREIVSVRLSGDLEIRVNLTPQRSCPS
ncbi:unnamed protein product [Klebsiella pneumoniae]|nr:unnamed protein product [Klebsiella pneumoniae]